MGNFLCSVLQSLRANLLPSSKLDIALVQIC
jgi:hypothetical protein